MPSLSSRIAKVAETIGIGVAHEHVNVIFATRENGDIFILIIHNTALQGIVKPSVHDTDITDEQFIKLASREQRVSTETIYQSLSNNTNFVLDE